MNPASIGRGTLQVLVTVGDDPSPIQGARVRVTDPADGAVLAELTTDSSGQTETIELPTPPIEDSIAESDVRPYATYNVTATAEGFETLHISGVQLLPDSLSVQRSSMGPAKAGFNVRNVMLEPHTLWGDFPPKIPEDEVKPLPDAGGLVVLPKPVVPEFIVVHMGVPSDSSAPNHWIFFRDYIKNVACSEIYSTWQTEAIKANVLAILSFTLNRVFTEWYRGKGYDFTITNSTAYDQSFVMGRTIFERISQVVDDIFTPYITREGISQPLFAQYCDGRRVPCNGLRPGGSPAPAGPGPIAMPTSARARAGASLMPSPTIMTFRPSSWSLRICCSFSSGRTWAMTVSMPAFCWMALAVRALSPVSMTTFSPKS